MVKKVLCILMLVCMLLPVGVSCSKDDVETTHEDVQEVTTEAPTETQNKYEIYDDLGDIDLGGRNIIIGSIDNQRYLDEISVKGENGELVNDAIFTRNALVTSRLNCTLENKLTKSNPEAFQYSISTDLLNCIQSGEHMYDIVSAPVYCTIMFTGEGIFYDLAKVENIDLSKPYWSKYFNEVASLGGSQYMATGAVSLSFYRYLYVTLVNDKVLSQMTSPPDLIEVVNSNKWTLEYQRILTSTFYSDDGNNIKDENDKFGLITTDSLGVDGYLSSCEISLLKKGPDNYYEYAFNKERMSNVIDIVINLFKAESTWCYPFDVNHPTQNGEWEDITDKFASGDALMATARLESVEFVSIRNMNDTYTILPIPKYDEAQDTYYSFVHDSFTGMGIPSTTSRWDVDTFGAVMEAFASESYRTVTQSYYEVALKYRYASSPKSVEMLDMITQNVYIDGGVLYTKSLKNISQLFRQISVAAVRQGKGNTVSSTYNAEYESQVRTELDKLQSKIKAWQMQEK